MNTDYQKGNRTENKGKDMNWEIQKQMGGSDKERFGKERDIMGRCDRGANVGKQRKTEVATLNSIPSPAT